MKIKLKEKAIRLILSSFLQSNLTPTEIGEISEAFFFDKNFAQDIGTTLDQISNVLSNKMKDLHNNSNTGEFERELIDKAMQIIKRKRLSKKKMIAIIKEINLSLAKKLETRINNLKVIELLSEFYNQADINQFTEFLNKLEGGSSSFDKYLNGIIDR
jgi:hypothetical protein